MLEDKTLIENIDRSGYIFTSDIHNNVKTLQLIKNARQKYPQFTLVGDGDYIDGHRNAYEVLNYLMSIQNKVLLKGNHEQMLLNFAEGNDFPITGFADAIDPLWWSNGGKTTLAGLFHKRYNNHNYEMAVKAILTSKYYKWFKHMPIMYETPHIIFVHGGIHPDGAYNNPAKYPIGIDPSDDNYDMYRLWAREEYWYRNDKPVIDLDTGIRCNFAYPNDNLHYFAHNKTGKTIVTGHTPTSLINGAYDDFTIANHHVVLCGKFTQNTVLKVQYPGEPARIFTDGGCHGSYINNWGNITILSPLGEIIDILDYQHPQGGGKART